MSTSSDDPSERSLRRLPALARGLIATGALHVALGFAGIVTLAMGASRDTRTIPPLLPAVGWLAFVAGALLLLRTGADRRAQILGGVFLASASAFSLRPVTWLFQASGHPASAALANLLCIDAFIAALLWAFTRDFPRVLRLGRLDARMATLTRLAAAAGLALWGLNAHAAVGGSLPGPLALFRRGHSDGGYWALVGFLSVGALLALGARARWAPREERRRVSLFVMGLTLGAGPMLLAVTLEAFVPAYGRWVDEPARRLWSAALFYPPLLAIPFVTAYAVLARRILPVRTVAHRTASAFLARASLRGLLAVTLAALVVQLYESRDGSLASFLSQTGGRVWLAGATVVTLVLVARHRLQRALDAAFGEAWPDWSGLLGQVAVEARAARSAAEFAHRLTSLLRDELRVETALVLVRSPDGTVMAPPGTFGRPLPSASVIPTLAHEGAEPLVTAPEQSDSLFEWLPEEDRQWVSDHKLAILVPLVGREDRLGGLLGIGAHRSQRAFTREELGYLRALAGSAALALDGMDRTGAALGGEGAPPGDEPALECSRCGSVSAQDKPACGCGNAWTPAVIPAVLGGKFRVDAVLGRGGMGVAYRALDLELVRPVALKTLPRVSAQALRRLRSEARSMAAVSHPNLASIYGVESWRGVPVLVVEYLAGGTLADRLPGPLPVEEMLILGLTLADALQAMHHEGVLHRDVKPSNIGFTRQGQPKLLDFGLARLRSEARGSPTAFQPEGAPDVTASTEAIKGTPLYLSPQQLDSQPAAPADDVWSLCLVVYEGLTGAHPFRASSLAEVFDRVRRAAVPDPRVFRAELPGRLAGFFAHAFSSRPERRPQSAEELHLELAHVLAQLGTAA